MDTPENADIVFAIMPDGSDMIVKGKRLLEAIASSGEAKECNVLTWPVENWAEADALYRRFDGSN